MAKVRESVAKLLSGLVVSAVGVLTFLFLVTPVHASVPGINDVIDKNTTGGNPNADALNPAISGDGRYVTFQSRATNLVSTPTNGLYQIYVRDRIDNTTQLVSVSQGGIGGNQPSLNPRISNNGRYVVFESKASDLVSGDTNNKTDIFRRDLSTGITIRVSTSVTGGQSNDDSLAPDVSSDGNRIVFRSYASTILAGISGTNYGGIYVKDVMSGVVQLISRKPTSNSQANYTTSEARISCDGQTVVFASAGNNLIEGDSATYDPFTMAPRARVYLVDMTQNPITPVAIDPNTNAQDAKASISCDGNHVAFFDSGTNLTPTPPVPAYNIYYYNRATAGIEIISVDNNGNALQGVIKDALPAISGDGGFVAFTTVLTADPNDNNMSQDVYVRNVQSSRTELVSKKLTGQSGNGRSVGQDISSDGHFITYKSTSTDLVPGFGSDNSPNSGAYQIYLSQYDRLQTPINLTVTTPTNQPALSWDTVSDADSYDIYRDNVKIGSSTATNYTDSSVSEGTHAYYIKAKNSDDLSGPSSSVSVSVDLTVPSISYSKQSQANSNDWYNGDVTVAFTCNDALSGIMTCSSPSTINTEGAGQGITGTAVDNAGNSSSTTAYVNLDKTAPIFGMPSWSVNPIVEGNGSTLTIPVSDNLSGIESGEYYIGTDPGYGNGTSFTINNGDAVANISSLSAGVNAVFFRALDKAGNWSQSQSTDLTVQPPASTGLSVITPTSSDPVLSWTAEGVIDQFNIYRNGILIGSSINPTYTDVTAQEGASAYYVTSLRNGVESAQSNTARVIVDRTGPAVLAASNTAPNTNGWYNTDVTVNFTCNDAQTGIANCAAPITINSEGLNQVASGCGEDNAGNSTCTTKSVNIDKTAPVITASVSAAPNTNGWNSSPVTITFNCSDTLSGVASCTSPITISSEGLNQEVTGTAIDNAGNISTTTAIVSIDGTKPTIVATQTPAANGSGWNNTNVTVTYTCTDSLSGIASCSSPTTLSTEGNNLSATGVATDNAGNSNSVTISPIKLDKTVPTITGATMSNTFVLISSNETLSATVSDNLSGVTGGEFYVDTDPGQGSGIAMTYGNGKINGTTTISGLSIGQHKLYMRSKDVAGNWSTSASVTFVYI